MRRRNPTLGMIELWDRLRQRRYMRHLEGLFRFMRKLEMFPAPKPKKAYEPKPCAQMTHRREHIQADVKVVSRSCIADPEFRLFQHNAIDKFSRLGFFTAYPELFTCSLTDFLWKLTRLLLQRHQRGVCLHGQWV